MTRFRPTWGNPPGPGDRPGELHCVACGTALPGRAAVQCGECAHAWRWWWLLVLHDAWLWWRLDRRIRIRRSGKIYVCPCCAHDL